MLGLHLLKIVSDLGYDSFSKKLLFVFVTNLNTRTRWKFRRKEYEVIESMEGDGND